MKTSSQNAIRRTLAIMAKAPKPGVVKTRLAQSLPPDAVTTLYSSLLQDTVALANSVSDAVVAVMCPGPDVEALGSLLGDAALIVAQKGEGLAAGLSSVFAHFAPSDQHYVIAFNSDSPHLPAAVLENAFRILAAHDVVLGPTSDGGFYLVGGNAAHLTLFENDGMGTRSALENLLARARALELSTGFTEVFYDIDIADDLIRLAAELQLSPQKAPRTASWLAQWSKTVARLRPPAAGL